MHLLEKRASNIFANGNPLDEPIALFLTQATIIVVISRLLGYGLGFIKVPRVISEVLTGILIGQTTFMRFDSYREELFSPKSLGLLRIAAEFGLILFFFLIGLELDPSKLTKHSKRTMSVSLGGYVTPFVASIGVGKLVYELYYSSSPIPFAPFVLLLALAMSITGFPVLTRMLAEKKLLGTAVGQLTMDVAMFDDILTWILLLFVVPFIQNTQDYLGALYIFLCLVGYTLIMWFAILPIMTYISNMGTGSESLSQLSVLFSFGLIFLNAWFTQAIGAHAIFGALLVGIRTPHDHGFAIKLAEKMEDILMILLLPLYFAIIGINTDLTVLNTGVAWGILILVLSVASLSKIVGTMIPTRLFGFSFRESTVLGVLVNTKGIIGFIVLNMGYYAGILEPTIYAILVLLVILTSSFTIPLSDLIYPVKFYLTKDGDASVKSLPMQQTLDSSETIATLERSQSFKEMSFLIFLPNIQAVPAIMSMMELLQKGFRKVSVSALRLVPLTERESVVMMATDTDEALKTDPIMSVVCTFGQLNHIQVKPMFSVASKEDFPRNIIKASISSHSNLILIPWQPTLHGSRGNESIGFDTIEKVLEKSPCSVALFIDHGFGMDDDYDAVQKVVFPFTDGVDDREALSFVSYLVGNPKLEIVILHFTSSPDNTPKDDIFDTLLNEKLVTIDTIQNKSQNVIYETLISKCSKLKKSDLIVLGMNCYLDQTKQWINESCHISTILIQKHSKKDFLGV